MKYKKQVIFVLAIAVIAIALYGMWSWQQDEANQPIRQKEEIR